MRFYKVEWLCWLHKLVIPTSADIESIEKHSANSTKEALTDEAVFQDDARAADPDDDDLSFEMVTNDQSTNVVVIQNENLGRKQDQSKRIRRRIFTRSLK
ncbi:unnamed protein product, partial [Rotaria sp. Silwood1]